MKKIIASLCITVLFSACHQEPQSGTKSSSLEDEQPVTLQEFANQDISEVTMEDIPEEETIHDEFIQNTNESPVELHLSEQFNEHAAKMGNGNYLQLDVSAISDETTIYKVIVNRGNTCAPRFWYRNWPGHGQLKFGQSVRTNIYCDFHAIKEINVETDTGVYTFNF